MIGTGIALAIGLGSAAASAASNIYGAKKAAGVNEKAISAQERDSQRQVALDERRIAADQQRWGDYLRVHEPIWSVGGNALKGLAQMAGVPGGGGGAPRAGMAMPPGGTMASGSEPVDARWWCGAAVALQHGDGAAGDSARADADAHQLSDDGGAVGFSAA